MNVKLIVIGGSAGSFQVVTHLLAGLPKDFRIPIVLALHRLKHIRHGFVEALSIKSALPVTEPFDKDSVKPSTIYLAPANYHLYVDLSQNFCLSTEEQVMHSRPSIDLTMASVAFSYKEKAVGIILSGANKDGANGLKKMKENGATVIVQDPATAQVPAMPNAALQATKVDYILNPDDILKYIINLSKNG